MKNLKKLRKEKNITQTEFAKMFNTSQNSISDWERNKNMPHIGIIELIADYFKVTIDNLLGREKKEEENDGVTYPQRFVEVTEEEKTMLTKYRNLEEQNKARINILLESYETLQQKTKNTI